MFAQISREKKESQPIKPIKILTSINYIEKNTRMNSDAKFVNNYSQNNKK